MSRLNVQLYASMDGDDLLFRGRFQIFYNHNFYKHKCDTSKPCVDKWYNAQYSMRWKYLSYPKLQRRTVEYWHE